jgi:hypothetical protein
MRCWNVVGTLRRARAPVTRYPEAAHTGQGQIGRTPSTPSHRAYHSSTVLVWDQFSPGYMSTSIGCLLPGLPRQERRGALPVHLW